MTTARPWKFDTGIKFDTGRRFDEHGYWPAGVGLWIAWNGLPFNPEWYDDCTNLLISATHQRGGTPEITGAAQPGQATFVLQNPLGLFNPDNTDSPLYGKLTDGIPVWFGANDDGTLADKDGTIKGRFAGRITDISPLPVGGAGDSTPTVEIICEDALGWYSRTPTALSVTYPAVGAPSMTQNDVRAAALTAAGETDLTGLDSEPQIVTAWLRDGLLFDVLSELNAANGTRHFVKPADSLLDWYTYTTRNRNYKLGAAADVTIDPTDAMTAMDGYRITADGIVNQQKATVQALTFPGPSAEVWAYDQQPPLPFIVRSGTPYTLHVTFSDYVSPAYLLNLLTSTGDALTVVYEHHGASGDFTLTSAGSTAVRTWKMTGRIAARGPAISYTANDLVSQAKPRGIRAGPEISGDSVGNLDAATALATHIVWRYGDREGHGGILRPSVQLANWLPAGFTVDLYDLVGIVSPQLRATGRVFEIVGLTEAVDFASDAGVSWTDTLQLQESRVQPGGVIPGTTIFTLDVSLLDGPDVLAG